MTPTRASDTLPSPETAPAPKWTAIQRGAFRFCFAYFGLYGIALLLPILPFGDFLSGQWSLANVAIGRWLRMIVLRLPEHGTPPFSDPLDLFLFDMLLVVVSIFVALAWSVLDAGRTHYTRLYDWLYSFVRIALAAEMFIYGWSKLLPHQFWGGRVPLYDLAQPLGQLQPQRLVWAMMGLSRPYAIFGGAMEWLGALLLCFRRTATFGSVILIGTLTNVVMLNFAYDIGVKVHATNLLVMALFLAAPDIGRLSNVLLFNRPTEPRPVRPLFRSAGLNRLIRFAAPALAVLLAYRPLPVMLADLRSDGAAAPIPPLYGIFEVDTFARNGAVAPPLLTDPTRWRRVVFERSRRATVTLMSDSLMPYRTVTDTNTRTVQLSSLQSIHGPSIPGRGDTLQLSYERPTQSYLILRGVVRGDSLRIGLRYVPSSNYRLLNARHRWAW